MTLEVYEQRIAELEAGRAQNAHDINALTALVSLTVAQHAATAAQLEALTKQVSSVVDVINAVQGAFKVLDFIGKAAKPVAYLTGIGAAVMATWQAMGGKPH